MKLIISESKRNKIVIKYLNKYYGNLFVKNYERYNVKDYISTESGLKIFNVTDRVLHVLNRQLLDELINLFGLNKKELDDLLIPWFEETYGDNVYTIRVNC